MVKLFEGNLDDNWLTVEKIKELSGCDIGILIDGLSISAAKSPKGDVLVNLRDLEKYLIAVKKIANSLLEAPPPEKINDKPPVLKVLLSGKQVTERLSLTREVVIELIEKHGLPAKRRGKGWQIDPDELEKFSNANQELIRSLKSKAEEPRQENNGKNEPGEKVRAPSPVLFLPPASGGSDTENPQNADPSTLIEGDKQSDMSNKDASQNSDPAAHQEEDKTPKYVSIKLTGYGCKVDDVATAIPNISMTTVMKWIEGGKVKTINGPGPRGQEQYIKPESLRAFLLEQRNTVVTFDETKGVRKLHWPDAKNPTPPAR